MTPPKLLPGLYVVAASADPGFQHAGNRVLAVNLLVTDLVLTVSPDGQGRVIVRAVSGKTGKRLGGVDIALYRYDWQKGHQRVDKRRTGESGEVELGPDNLGGSHFLVGQHGHDLALDPSWLSLIKPKEGNVSEASLVYTDRSIYRPLQHVKWKVVSYRGRSERADWKVSPEASLMVSLVDPNGQVVERKMVKTNSFGSAAGEFQVPAGRLLGAWQVRSSWIGDRNGYAQVRVEEYKRPTFEVSLLDPEGTLRLNRPVALKGEAKYYFGLPVTSGQVRWRVTREAVYPWWWGWFYGGVPGAEAQTIASGEAKLGAEGRFAIGFTAQADEKASEGVTYRYLVEADLTDEGGETRSAARVPARHHHHRSAGELGGTVLPRGRRANDHTHQPRRPAAGGQR